MADTHLDAGVLIGFLSATDAHHPAATAVLTELLQSGDSRHISASVYAEILVGAEMHNAVQPIESLLMALDIKVVPIGQSEARLSAKIRARHKVKLPDALALAGALANGASFITTDRRWPQALQDEYPSVRVI